MLSVLGSLFRKSNANLEMILSRDLVSGEDRGFKPALEMLDTLMKDGGLKYCVTGALALGLYTPSNPRNTKDIDLLLLKSSKSKFLSLLDKNKIKYKKEDDNDGADPNIRPTSVLPKLPLPAAVYS